MTLHCLSRLEVISYLYSHRHELSYALGITTERVISICKGDYFQRSTLNQQTDNDQSPSGLAQAQEIILGIPSAILLTPEVSAVNFEKNLIVYHSRKYFSPCLEIFHPPLILV